MALSNVSSLPAAGVAVTRPEADRTSELEARTAELEERTLQLEKANKDLEAFTYSVSHDLRAPLRAISGFAHILTRSHAGAMDTQGRHFLENIVEAGAQMGRLIEDLLAYSRLGRRTPTLRPVALRAVLEQVLTSVQPRIDAFGGVVSLPADLPIVQGDHTLLLQTFTNLVENALIYARPGVTPVVTVAWRRDSGAVVVSVGDNGLGIAPEYFGKIFEVFQRLHSQEAFPGTGVGLALVKRAVELQGGQITLDSSPGAGSTFNVRLAGVR